MCKAQGHSTLLTKAQFLLPCRCKVTPGDLVFIEKIHADITDELAFDRVLLLGTREESVLGRPYIPGASVRAVVEVGHTVMEMSCYCGRLHACGRRYAVLV